MANELTAPAPAGPLVGGPGTATHDLARAAPGLPALAPLLLQLRSQPRIGLIVGGAVLAAAVASLFLWGRAPDYRLLYANVSDRDGGAIVASLQQMNVPYKFSEGGGAIMVPAEQVPELRLKLAAQGLPKAGGVGFELLDNQKFGTSQFAEQVNYQRGLEGELARSIESMGPVQAARVHLALPKPSLFVREQKKPSASVVLTLHPGRSLDEGQVSAVVHMVSSSVSELEAKAITVVDQRGNLLSAANAGSRALDGSQLKFVENIEQSYVRRIEAILQPLVGAGNVRAQVAADVDFSVVENTDEKYRPNQDAGASAIRSQQSSESAQDGGAAVGGVPGALSNQPPLNPTAPLAAASGPAGGAAALVSRTAKGNSRRDVTTNYEVDRTIRHTQQAAGTTRRLSAAVVVNHKEVRAANGKTSTVALTPAELAQVTNLVKEAMGFNQARGDSVNVVNSPFSVDTFVAPEVPFWKDRENIDLVRGIAPYLLSLVGVLFAGVALLRGLRRQPAAPVQLDAVAATPAAAMAAPAELTAAVAARLQPPDHALERELARRQANLEYAQDTATREPQVVAGLMRHWMNEAHE